MNKKGQLVRALLGVLVGTIVGVAVVIPVIQDVIENSAVTGTTATILNYLGLMIAVVLFTTVAMMVGGN